MTVVTAATQLLRRSLAEGEPCPREELFDLVIHSAEQVIDAVRDLRSERRAEIDVSDHADPWERRPVHVSGGKQMPFHEPRGRQVVCEGCHCLVDGTETGRAGHDSWHRAETEQVIDLREVMDEEVGESRRSGFR